MTLLLGRIVSACGAAIALVGTFLPWLRSGAVDRSSFEVRDIVERIGFSPDGLVGLALTVWPVVPLLLVLVMVAQWPGWSSAWAPVGAATFAGATGIYVAGTAVAVLTAPDVALFQPRIGVWITMVGGLVTAAGGGMTGIGLRWGRPTGLGRRGPA